MNSLRRLLISSVCILNLAAASLSSAATANLTVKECRGNFALTTEGTISRITVRQAEPTWPLWQGNWCSLDGESVNLAENRVLDFWLRVRSEHSVAINVAFGRGGIGYHGYEHLKDHALNIVGRQTGTPSLGDLGPVNDGNWHHIVFDLAYAIESQFDVRAEEIGKVVLSLSDEEDGFNFVAGSPAQDMTGTIELRDVMLRPPRLQEPYLNDLALTVASSPLAATRDGKTRRLLGGTVVSREPLEGASLSLEGANGTLTRQSLGTVQGRRKFSLVFATAPAESEARVRLLDSSGRTKVERTLRLQPALTYLEKATVYVIPSSHNDIGWLDTPEATANWRHERVIGGAIPLLQRYPNYRFDMESNLFLMEYLNRAPEQAATVRQLMAEGRLAFGAMFNSPYPSLWRGESLTRQLYYGRKWLREHLGSEVDSVTAWGTDVPAVGMQMPQILAKAGVKYLMLGRFRRGVFDWYSPDGSKVTVGALGMYGHLSQYLRPYDPVDVALQFPVLLRHWEDFYQEHKVPPAIPVTDMTDYLPPRKELVPLIEGWKSTIQGEHGGQVSLRFATGEEFMNAVTRDPNTRFPVRRGEWPNVWAYIHGPTHHDTVSAGREAVWALTAAEKLWTLRTLASGGKERYPKETFDQAWMAQIYPDHGFGGFNGDITDAVFLAKEKEALLLGQTLLNSAVDWIALHARPLDQPGQKLVIVNPLSWGRSGPAWVDIPTPPDQEAVVVDEKGNVVPIQRTPQPSGGAPRYLVEARNVPSVGYSTFAVRFKPRTPPVNTVEPKASKVFENEYYRLEFAPGGLKSIYDKPLQRELLRPEPFLAGEVYMLDSVGTGAGEFGDIQRPSWDHVEKSSQYSPPWKMIESGPVRTGWRMEQPFREATVRLDVYAYAKFKRLDFNVQILNWSGEKNKEFRMAIPANIPNGQVAYEVPYGVLEVGKDEIEGKPYEGWYDRPAREIHPREVQDWIAASDGNFTIMLSSSVAMWDYLDAQERNDRLTLLQPILLAARKSCHSRGNWYLQKGDHSFRFSLTSFAGGWRSQPGFGNEINSPLPSAVVPAEAVSPEIPSAVSLCQSSQPGFIVSEIKMADDRNGIIVRGYETTGRDAEVILRFPLEIERVNETSLIEEDLSAAPPASGKQVQLKVGQRSINTYRVVGRWKPAGEPGT